MAHDTTSELNHDASRPSHNDSGGEATARRFTCGRSLTEQLRSTTRPLRQLIINSDICHSEYIQPGWFFCVNCHGRYSAGDAPNGLAGTEARLAHGVAPWVRRRLVEQSQLVARREGLSGFAREFWLWWLKLGGRKS
jgi:hypothetical protein